MSVQAVVLGGTGYVGGELIRLIAQHPGLELAAAISGSRTGDRIADLFPHLAGAVDSQRFAAADDWPSLLDRGAEVALFSAMPHGAAASAIAGALARADARDLNVRVVDASADFRFADLDRYAAVYGAPHPQPALAASFTCAVPEHLEATPAGHIAHPGCFATAMLLAAVPLIGAGVTTGPLFVSGITGSTGSGRQPVAGTHHPERQSNLYAYKPLEHRHAPEVEALIASACGKTGDIRFVPHSGPFARGIHVTLQASIAPGHDRSAVDAAFNDAYSTSPFVHVVEQPPRIKNVVASNNAHLAIASTDDTVTVMCAIDNLVKGAAGGAVQWMNRLWSLPETDGLGATAPGWT